MEGLANYGSDDECEESPQRDGSSRNSPESEASSTTQLDKRSSNNQHPVKDDNYDDIGMDLSENDGKSPSLSPSHTPPRIDAPKESKHRQRKRSRTRSPPRRSRSSSRSSNERSSKRKDYRKRRAHSRSVSKGRSHSNSRSRSKSRSRSRSPSSRRRGRDDYKQRERDKDKYRRNRRRRSRSRDERDSRDSRDSRSSRDGRGSWKESRDSRKDSRSYREPRESRDFRDTRDRYGKRFDRASNKLAHLEKMGIDVNKSQDKKPTVDESFNPQVAPAEVTSLSLPVREESRLLPPGVTGRLREQMERRKALWQKKEPVGVQPSTATPVAGKVWETTTFAHDQEGKQANKFKRLMGIREASSTSTRPGNDLVKKQEELFSSMEQQYEVARTATHTMRGVGLGFGSYQR